MIEAIVLGFGICIGIVLFLIVIGFLKTIGDLVSVETPFKSNSNGIKDLQIQLFNESEERKTARIADRLSEERESSELRDKLLWKMYKDKYNKKEF